MFLDAIHKYADEYPLQHTHTSVPKQTRAFIPSFSILPFSQELQVILQLRFSKSDNLEYETKTQS